MSKFRIETLSPLKYCEWNSFVDRSPQGDVFCYSWWLDAITKSNFKILIIVEENEIVAGIPLSYDSDNKVNEPPVTRTLGVLFKPQYSLPEYKKVSDQRRWLHALLERIEMNDFVQTCTHHNVNDWLPFRWKGLKQTTKYTYLIDYQNKTIDDLYNNLSRDKKVNIKKAIKNCIRIELTDDFKLLFQFVSYSFERQGIKFNIKYEDLKKLDEAIINNGSRIIFKAVDDKGRVHAMIYIVFNKRSAYQLLSGSDYNLRKLGGHTFARWEAIKFFIGKVHFFNFGGSNIQSIEEHVRGYGGTLTPYFHIYNENLLWKRTDIRFHLNEISFHLFEILKNLKSKLLQKKI